MKTSLLLSNIVAATLLCCGVRAQTNSLEDRPFEPSASVVKGTVAALADSSDASRRARRARAGRLAADVGCRRRCETACARNARGCPHGGVSIFRSARPASEAARRRGAQICRRSRPKHSRCCPRRRLRRAGVRRKCGSDLATTQRLAQRRAGRCGEMPRPGGQSRRSASQGFGRCARDCGQSGIQGRGAPRARANRRTDRRGR